MRATEVVELIKNKDWTFTETPFSIDPGAATDIRDLMKDDDPEVRELALFALNSIDGPQRRQGNLKGLRDKDVNVRSAACHFLLVNHDRQDLQALHEALQANDDEFVREHVSLVLGKIGDPRSKMVVMQQMARETDADAKHAMHLALVRLKDRENRKRYAAGFHDPDPKKRVRSLKDFGYVEDRAFIADILPLLDDERDGLNVGPSRKKIYIRVCDVAVNVLDQVFNHPFSFEIGEKKTYSRDERNAAASMLSTMKD